MDGYAVAHVDQIGEVDDGRAPMRAVRHHFGVTAFGVNALIGREAGDRHINEHDESEPDSNEELYLVLRGRASFEVDGERFDAAAGTFVFVRPGVKRTAFAEESGTAIVAVGGVPGMPYEPSGWELFAPLRPLYEAGDYAEAAARGRELLASDPPYPSCSTTSPVAKASPARRIRRSPILGARLNSQSAPARSLKAIPTSIRSARPRPSSNCSQGDFGVAMLSVRKPSPPPAEFFTPERVAVPATRYARGSELGITAGGR
jgi:Cupin domain